MPRLLGADPAILPLGLVRKRRSNVTASLQVNTYNYDPHRPAFLAIQLSVYLLLNLFIFAKSVTFDHDRFDA